MNRTQRKEKTKAELNVIVLMVREVFEATGITVKKIEASNGTTLHTIAIGASGKVRLEKNLYDWELYFEFKDSKITYVDYNGPKVELGLRSGAEVRFTTKKYAVGADEMRTRIDQHFEKMEKLVQQHREILHLISIFDKTVSAALAAFTLKLQEQFKTQLPDPIQQSPQTEEHSQVIS